jgi:phosphoribosyl-AMP cyclohydrolase
MPTEEFVDRWVSRLRREVPDAVGIFVGGSYLRGDGGPFSDIDFDIVVPLGPRDEGPTWYDRWNGRLVRIDAWVRDVDAYLATAEQAQDWAFYLPCTDRLRLCWSADERWRQRLDRPDAVHPAGPPELEHLVGEVSKIANASHRGDELAMRLAAQDLGRSVASLVAPLNPGEPVTSRVGALRRILDFEVVPAGYREDMLTCLGLTAASATQISDAARRLGRGVIDLVHDHEPFLADHLSRHAREVIRDGSLRQYLEPALAKSQLS